MSHNIAVAARIQDSASRYGNIPRVKQMLDYLGVSVVRTGAVRYRGASSWTKFEQLARYGDVWFIMTVRDRLSPRQVVEDLDIFAQRFPGKIIGLEGPNEIDHNPVTWTDPRSGVTYTDSRADARTWPRAAMGYQKELSDRVGNTRSLRDVPLVCFSDFQQEAQRQAGIALLYNQHPYPRRGSLLSDSLRLEPAQRLQTVITETGAPSRPDPRFYPNATTRSQEAFIADAVERVIDDRMIKYCAFYQLMDNYKDRTGNNTGGMEYHFGLFDYDYRPKPAAVRLREMLQGR